MAGGIGILGFAHGHVGVYCAEWKKVGAGAVVGWDHDAKRLGEVCEKLGMEQAASAEAVCGREDVSAVVIGAETSRHAELVEMAARAGKAVVLQKPMALTVAEADRIVAAVEKAGVPFTLAWQMRVDPQNRKMKELVDSGVLGRVFMVRRRHGLPTHAWPWFKDSWHVKPELNRGVWADDASHAIDFLLWLMGEPQSVTAEIGTLHNPKVPDDNGVAVFRYADGTLAEVACSFTCLAGENTTEIVAENGVVIQNFGDLPSANAPRPPGGIGLKWLMKGDKQWTVSDIASPAGHGQRITGLAPEIVGFLRGERGPICTAAEGRTSLRMTLACYRSAELGRRVRMDEV